MLPSSGVVADQIRSQALNLPSVFTPSRFVAEEPPLFALGNVPAQGDGEHLPPDRALSCIAAFYPCESAMRDAARSLLKHHGLNTSQLVLMGPRDADPVRFARQTLRWTGRWSGGHGEGVAMPQFLAIAAGLSLLASAIGWWLLESDTPLVAMLVSLVVVLLSAALLGDRLVWPWADLPRGRRFETSVRRQLLQGHWALVAHRIPRGRQPGVLALLRGASLRWCAVARPSMRL